MSWSTFLERRAMFSGAILTVALGVALVQACLMVMVSAGDPKIPVGASGKEAEQIREGYVGAATLLGMAVPLALFLAVFIVGSTFAFTVAQRRRELALVRILGGSRPQMVWLLLCEAVLLGAAGSAAGVALGIPGTWVQAKLLVAIGLLPDGFGVGWNWAILPVSFGLGISVSVCGVLAASYRAARIRPLDAVRDSPQAARVMTIGRWLVGTSSLALTVLMVGAGQSADLLGALLIAMAVSITGSVALSQLSPLLVPVAGRALGAVLRLSPLGDLAQANLRDGVRRSASTAAPLIVLVGLVIGLIGALNSLARATGADVRRLTDADLVVSSQNAAAVDRIARIPGVATASPQIPVDIAVTARHREDVRSFRQTHHLGIVAVDGAAYQRTHRFKPHLLDGLRGNTIAVGPGMAEAGVRGPYVTARIGDRKVRLRIVARLPATLENGSETFLVPRELIPAGTVANDSETQTMIKVAPGTPVNDVARQIRAAGLGEPRTVAAWADARVDAQQSGTMGIMAVLMGLSGLYAAVAVVNAVVIAGTERRAEFAVARVTGLSRGQVVRMALTESMAVTLIGLLLGSLVAAGALAGFRPGPGGVQVLAVPWGLLALLSAGSFAVTAVASVLTAWSATKASPVSLVAARE
ncbi:FtsX-like permease family protein [Actinomadura barringtoniae]|nr:FtsX-like permease family protein [Actinomadura barringtoniae]